jgi:hypothetical protein
MKERYLVENIAVGTNNAESEALEAARRILRHLGAGDISSLRLHRKSLDARRRSVRFVCSVFAECEMPRSVTEDELKHSGVKRREKFTLSFTPGKEPMAGRPVIVGFGPAGMFAALTLCEYGYRPVVLERGGDVDERVRAVESFLAGGALDLRSNVQFGAGGAGTFSDGKLTCRIGDAASEKVLDTLVSLGAPEDITYKAKPHVGTDVLRGVVKNAAARIRESGGEVRFDSLAENIGDSSLSVGGERISFGALVLACGHSARDTYRELIASGYGVSAKAYSVGVRIEHLRDDVNRAMLGEYADLLPPAEYGFSERRGERGVYTFCMCPGGVVTASSSEDGTVVTNGMSFRARDGRNSNSALCVSVLPGDFGDSPLGAISFQNELEKRAFELGGSSFAAPAQTVGDFLGGTSGTRPTRVIPTYRGGDVRLADLRELFPRFITGMLELGITSFARKMKGFDSPDAILCGVESRTSSPVRITRGEGRNAPGHDLVYPCGEGAGYAGGIVSAAVDGIRTAGAIIERFAPCER